MAVFTDFFYTVEDGLILYARDYAGPGVDAPVVLCMHGLSRNSRDFEPIAPMLAITHRVVVVEQRGRGRSEYDDNSDHYVPQTYVADMFALLSQLDISRCATVGTSMGGLMAMAMSALAPNLFSHVVINDIGPDIAPEGLARIKQYVGMASAFDSWDDAIAHTKTVNGDAFPDYSDEQWRDFAGRICTERGGKVCLDYDTTISEPMKRDDGAAVPSELWSLFDSFASTPVLLVRGELSDILAPDCVTEMQRRIPSMRTLTVPRVGHAPVLNEPGVAEAICAFINR